MFSQVKCCITTEADVVYVLNGLCIGMVRETSDFPVHLGESWSSIHYPIMIKNTGGLAINRHATETVTMVVRYWTSSCPGCSRMWSQICNSNGV